MALLINRSTYFHRKTIEIMLKTKVKASDITNLTDARYFAALEVAWLSFNLQAGTPSSIELGDFMAIKEWVEGPTIVGAFDFQETEYIQAAIQQLELKAIQLGHFAPIAQVMALQGTPILKEIMIENALNQDEIQEHLFMYKSYVDVFILKGSVAWKDIQNSRSEIAFLKKICSDYRIIIDFQFEAAEVEALLTAIEPEGISVKGGEEEAVGIKSFDELDDLFDNLVLED